MALPIKPTPKLDEEETKIFYEVIEQQTHIKTYPKSNKQKLEHARKKAQKYAHGHTKQYC